MKFGKSLAIRFVSFLALIAILALSFSESHGEGKSIIDIRAAFLVLLAPALILMIFQKELIAWGTVFKRIRELIQLDYLAIQTELEQNTPQARGQYGFSHTVRLTETHSDSMMRYAGDLFAARFNSDEMAKLLAQKIQSEDSHWQAVINAFSFLSKMAPYFGMLATVIGMSHLLANMNDFSQLSGGMAMAMQGTLYGLMSFTLLYAPLHRFAQDMRSQIFKRNELIARWFILLSQQADPSYIQQDILSLSSEKGPLVMNRISGQPASTPRSAS